jgi:hypothetical protein
VIFPEVVDVGAPGVAHEVGGVPVPQHILNKVVGSARLLFVAGHHHGVSLTLANGKISPHTPKCLIFIDALVYFPWFWIRIDLMRPTFFLIADPDPDLKF